MALILDGTSGITTPAETITTNLTFTGTGNRITGDLSNATVDSRALFQTSTVNGQTRLSVIPNGTENGAAIDLYNSSSDTSNSSRLSLRTSSTEMGLVSSRDGTGTYLPMAFYTGGSERARIDTSGNVGIGLSNPSSKLDVFGVARASTLSLLGTTAFSEGTISQDINWGMYFKAASAAAVEFAWASSAATERMRIDSSGNVGIGTSSPLGKLKVTVGDVAPAASGNMNTGVIYEVASGSRAINFGVNNTAGYSWINAAFSNNSGVPDNLVLMTGATERMRIDSSGYVGIGTASPSSKLDVNAMLAGYGGNLTSPVATITGANCATNGGGNLRVFANTSAAADVGGSMVFGGYYSAQVASVDYAEIAGRKQTGQTTGGYLSFSTRADLGDQTQRMRIDSSGNVGIGTSSPTVKLDVLGDAKFGATVNTGAGVTTGVASIELGSLRTGDGVAHIDFHGISGGDYQSRAIRSGGVNGALLLTNTGTGNFAIRQEGAGSILFDTNNTERMRIDSSGNVGIGTTSPAARLDINTTASGNILNVQGTAGASAEINISLTSGTGNKECILNFGNNLGTAGRYIGRIFYQTDNNVMGFWTNTTERMRITAAGGLAFSGSNVGTTGQILTSNGDSAPIWNSAFSGPLTGGVNITTAANYTVFAANTPTKIADLGSLDGGTHALLINYGYGYAADGTSSLYWGSVFGTTISITSNSMYYNGSPIETLIGCTTQHHRVVGLPVFTLKSDASLGSYGRLCLYVSFPQITNIDGWIIKAKLLVS